MRPMHGHTNHENAFFLIDDKNHASWPYPYTGWDTDYRGADKANEQCDKFPVRKVVSVLDTAPTTIKRDITEQFGGKIGFECMFKVNSGDGFYLGFFNNTDEAFKIEQRNGMFCAAKKTLFAIDDKKHHIKFYLNIDSGKAGVFFDGRFIGEVGFTGSAKSISSFRCGYAEKDIGDAQLYHFIKMYKNYYVNDCVTDDTKGKLSDEYTVETVGKSTVERKPYSLNRPECVYFIEGKKDSKTTVSRSFDRASGVVCFEAKYLLPKKNGKLTLGLYSTGKCGVSVYDCLTEICTPDGALKKHSFDVFQTLRIEADTHTKTALVRLNGKKVSTIAFENNVDFFDEIRFTFDAEKASEALLCDIFVFEIPPLAPDYVPEPVVPKKKGDYYVGMNICSLWRTGDHYGWDTITPFDEVKPLLGYYDEGLPETADWELKWMCEHGIDFELYCWYASQENAPFKYTQLSSAIHGGHMLAKYSDKVKIALLWEAANAAHPAGREAFRKYFVPYWIDYFFSDERYMRIDNKAIMSIFGPNQLIKDFGSAQAVKEEFDYLRSEVKKLGYDDLIIMGCANNDPIYKECGFDAVHAYNWGKSGNEVKFTKDCITSNIARKNVHVVPTVSTGFNNVGWAGTRSPNMTPEAMKTLLTWCRDDILPTFEKDSWKSKLVMLSTWNEYGEGTYIMPSGLNGFGYLDAVRSVFREDLPHKDVAPNEHQKSRINILHPKDRATIAPLDRLPIDNGNYGVYKKYEFKNQKDLDMWEPVGFSSLTFKNKMLIGKSEQHDPYMLLKDKTIFPLKAERISKIKVHIKAYKPVNQMCCIELFYSTRADGVINSRGMPVLTDPTQVAELTFNVQKRQDWTGTITALRFDPIYAVGDFELLDIEFIKAPPHTELSIDGTDVSMCIYPELIDGVDYIPFDTKSGLVKIKTMYYEWHKPEKQLVIWAKEKNVFTVGSEDVLCGDRVVKMKRPLEMKDGLPMLPLELFAEILGMKMKKNGNEINLVY